jgi:hypothetical protein
LCLPGAEGTNVEFIARGADASTVSSKGETPRMLSVGEVGIGVVDVLGTEATLSEELAIAGYYGCSSTFASMGGHDGLLVVVHQDRVWSHGIIPTGPTGQHPSSGPAGRAPIPHYFT